GLEGAHEFVEQAGDVVVLAGDGLHLFAQAVEVEVAVVAEALQAGELAGFFGDLGLEAGDVAQEGDFFAGDVVAGVGELRDGGLQILLRGGGGGLEGLRAGGRERGGGAEGDEGENGAEALHGGGPGKWMWSQRRRAGISTKRMSVVPS